MISLNFESVYECSCSAREKNVSFRDVCYLLLKCHENDSNHGFLDMKKLNLKVLIICDHWRFPRLEKNEGKY